jgi:ankyrin repeat protein
LQEDFRDFVFVSLTRANNAVRPLKAVSAFAANREPIYSIKTVNRSMHNLVLKADVARLKELLSRDQGNIDINASDSQGFTPIMRAITNPKMSVEIVRLLLDHGADIKKTRLLDDTISTNAMALALGAGNPEIVRLLIERGGDIHYQRESGYGAVVDAVHGRDILHDPYLIDLLTLLIENDVTLNSITSYGESGLRVLSQIGRFDAVKVLLDAGADPDQLRWTSLMRAVALGSPSDVMREVEQGISLEDQDCWSRTAWLIAIQTGDLAKAKILYDVGANIRARGRCGKPPIFYAVENHHLPMLNWLLKLGADLEETDEFGESPLLNAVESNNLPAVERLLKAGANLSRERHNQTALNSARTREIAEYLLAAGSDPSHLSFESRRALLGFEPEPSPLLFDASSDDFREQWRPRFGISNPQKIEGKFYEEMVRSGINAFQASQLFCATVEAGHPIWCAQRYGQSICSMPDGRIIQIGGEHEDYYDDDFCIYNDIFVHHPGGAIEFFNYPEEVFPPTDFHTATLIGDRFIWIIGSLGYFGRRHYGETPVYRLDTESYRIERMKILGEPPGWIYGHAALVLPGGRIQISGGEIISLPGDKESHIKNNRSFILDTEHCTWSNDGR